MITVTRKSFYNCYVHYDENNSIVGYSKPNPICNSEFHHTDLKGNFVGYSVKDFGGGYIHYNVNKNIIGRSSKMPFGGYIHYIGNKVAGRSEVMFGGDYRNCDLTLDIFSDEDK